MFYWCIYIWSIRLKHFDKDVLTVTKSFDILINSLHCYRDKLFEIFGISLSFVATRSGLTRYTAFLSLSLGLFFIKGLVAWYFKTILPLKHLLVVAPWFAKKKILHILLEKYKLFLRKINYYTMSCFSTHLSEPNDTIHEKNMSRLSWQKLKVLIIVMLYSRLWLKIHFYYYSESLKRTGCDLPLVGLMNATQRNFLTRDSVKGSCIGQFEHVLRQCAGGRSTSPLHQSSNSPMKMRDFSTLTTLVNRKLIQQVWKLRYLEDF